MQAPLVQRRRPVPAALFLALAGALAGPAGPAVAQRDPLQPPPEARATASDATPGASANAGTPASPRQLMSVDGRRYVVFGTRRHGVGELLGSARIERIDDSAVWVREGGTLTRLPVHGPVRRVPAIEDAASAAAASASAAPAPQRPGRERPRAAPNSRPAPRGAP
ncbi:hypothetical protein [Rubrivivax rivuli]|uniref:MSHA biogenesis protein MshK n=1 Tax=Rubrivivax rivuli TaxID=1862385 RepID=A0A437RCC3_9BURK|nr:hypothetical protein [Rubrivivax rivuli]RVU44428.1 hypothetical protein EOE66_17320 [Rubrivivax rivuli]